MGVLYYYICETCKQYLDAGKVSPPLMQRPDVLETKLEVFPQDLLGLFGIIEHTRLAILLTVTMIVTRN